MCYHNCAMACYVSHIDQDTWTYLCLDFYLFHDKAQRTEQGNLLGKACLYSKSVRPFAGQWTRSGSNDGRERTMARHVSQIDHQPDKKKNGIPGHCVLPLQLGAMAKVREQRHRPPRESHWPEDLAHRSQTWVMWKSWCWKKRKNRWQCWFW